MDNWITIAIYGMVALGGAIALIVAGPLMAAFLFVLFKIFTG